MKVPNTYFSKEYFLGIPYNLSMVNTGSTFSQFAFNNYRELKINGCNMALQHNSLENDFGILKKYYSHLCPKAIVAITLAPCVMMYRSFHQNNGSCLSKSAIKSKIKSTLGRFNYGDVTDYYPLAYSDKLANKHISELAQGWKTLFSLANLKESNLSNENIKNIQFNTIILSKMIAFCYSHDFVPIIVITPMSNILNQYFSDDFVNTALLNPLNKAIENSHSVHILNYRKDPQFCNHNSFYLDGGFRLSKLGSKVFMRRFLIDLKNLGYDIA